MVLSASVVVYSTPTDIFDEAVKSFLSTPFEDKILFVVDNSKGADYSYVADIDRQVVYIKTDKNLGFGRAHNVAIRKAGRLDSAYHLIMNPDVFFGADSLVKLVDFMEEHKEAPMSSPKVCNPDGSLQFIYRKFPTFFSQVKRRLNPFGIFDSYNAEGEMRHKDYGKPFEFDFCHGCFMLFRTAVLEKLDGFDERFFMYMEDVDICRRAKKYGKTMYCSNASIVHYYQKESGKHFGLFVGHLASIVKYNLKYGFSTSKVTL